MASQVIDNVDPLMLQRIILDKFIGGTHNTYLFESKSFFNLFRP